jgi:hypothetical protein
VSEGLKRGHPTDLGVLPDNVMSWLKLPIIGCPGMECSVPTTAEGLAIGLDGEPLPMSDRTETCGVEGRWMLGSVFLCQNHAAQIAEIAGDDIAEIERAWRAQL